MTIDEAIKILQRIDEDGDILWRVANVEALKLGIEALKRIKRVRSPFGYSYSYKLPGETK